MINAITRGEETFYSLHYDIFSDLEALENFEHDFDLKHLEDDKLKEEIYDKISKHFGDWEEWIKIRY